MDALFLAAFFASVFIFTLILSAIVDWALFQLLGVRLYPRRFFKSDKEVWKQWQTFMKLLKQHSRKSVRIVVTNAQSSSGASTVAISRCQTNTWTINWTRQAMNINQIHRFDCPMKALDEAKRSLKAKGFGERHILQTEKGLYRVINPRTQINKYCMVVARLYHPPKS